MIMLIYRRYLFALVLLLPFFVSGAPVSAPAAETKTTPQKPAPADVAKKKRAVEKYRQLAEVLQSQGGVYEVQLSEVLLDLGKTYQSLELHNEAIATLKRSLQISRVNSGLYHLDQVAILEQMLKSNKALQDWEMVNANYAYLYWVNKRNYGDFDPQLLPVIERLGKWHLHAYTEALDERPFLHLFEADKLYSRAIAIIELEHGHHSPQLLQALYRLALTNYQVAAYASDVEKLNDLNHRLRRTGNHQARARQQELARQDLVFRSYVRGKKAIARIIAIHADNETLPLDSHALALTHLGDWYLLFNKHNSAAASYDQAYTLMSAGEENKKDIDDFFAQPQMLPASNFITEQEWLKVTDETPYAVAMFNVSPGGRARNIEIVEIGPVDNPSLKRRARRNIAGSKFRPRLENGKPVETTGFTMRYVFNK